MRALQDPLARVFGVARLAAYGAVILRDGLVPVLGGKVGIGIVAQLAGLFCESAQDSDDLLGVNDGQARIEWIGAGLVV